MNNAPHPNQQNLIEFNGKQILLEPTLKHRIRLYVKPVLNKNLQYTICIILQYHPTYTRYDIGHFLGSHTKWLDSTLCRLKNSIIPINATLKAHREQIMLFGQWHAPLSKSDLKKVLYEFLYEKVLYCAKEMRLECSKISIRESISRFGSCCKDRLSFSLLLVFAPKEQITYVIIHELAHIKHKNHSKDFWDLVAIHCPNYRTLRQNLKQNGLLYQAFLDLYKSNNTP